MEIKWVFGFFCITALTVIQLYAFVLGIDGQIFTATSSIIAALITFLLGLNINQAKQKQYIAGLYNEIIQKINNDLNK